MRLYLLPVSTRRSLLYCHRLTTSPRPPTFLDKATNKAAKTWLEFEQAPSGWKKSLTTWGNSIVQRIPFEEWSLRSVPPISYRTAQLKAQQKQQIDGATEETDCGKVVLQYPKIVIKDGAPGILQRLEKLTQERLGFHKKQLMWCVVGMPIVAPFALVPIIPNIPFFYLAYRAYCHYTAYQGGLHLQSLLKSGSIVPEPSEELDNYYQEQPIEVHESKELEGPPAEEPEKVVLTMESARGIGARLDVPDLAVECERAVRQVTIRIAEDEKKKQLEKGQKNTE